MDRLIISDLASTDGAVEIVERKGLGHPDTICDALAETLSRGLCREYRRRYGGIAHHNVDKALLTGGQSAPEFGGGKVLTPISICLSGRAAALQDRGPSVEEIAIDGSRNWLRSNLHALDPERDVNFRILVRPVSHDLADLFARRGSTMPLANDSSIGVGYAPLSALERLVLAVERRITAADGIRHPAWGEDVKVLGLRIGNAVDLTVACALIGRFIRHRDDYLAEKQVIGELAAGLAADHGFEDCRVHVNAADDPASASFYLTVTGTSAENGDDGEVGRGNRVNGLITPYRPMSLEAAAGKNPVIHTGKLYNVVARDIAEALVASVPELTLAQCYLVSSIGAPVTDPRLIEIKLGTRDGIPAEGFRRRVEEIAADRLARIPQLIDRFVDGSIQLF